MAGGILNIIAGAIGILVGLGLIVVGGLVDYLLTWGFNLTTGVPFIVGGIIAIAFGIVAVIGGAEALRRRHWRLALAASILARREFCC